MFVLAFSHKFHLKKILIEINWLFNKTGFGIRFALNQVKGKNTYIAFDKAKPRAIVGRKTTPACRNAHLPQAGNRACGSAGKPKQSPTVCGWTLRRTGTGPTWIARLPKKIGFCGARDL
jgi:hypothetical protein